MLDVRERSGAAAERRLALGTLDAHQWEGNFMPVLGLRADLGAPLVDEVVADKPAARAGMQKGDRIVAIDGAPMRSPSAVAAVTNAHPVAPMTFRVLRDGRTLDIALTPEAAEADGRRVGIAGLRLKVDPAEVDKVSRSSCATVPARRWCRRAGAPASSRCSRCRCWDASSSATPR